MAEEDLVTDFLRGGGRLPFEGSLAEISEIAEARDMLLEIWQFARLAPGSSLREHVQAGTSAGPHVEVRALTVATASLCLPVESMLHIGEMALTVDSMAGHQIVPQSSRVSPL